VTLDFCPEINIFYGNNAQGKTNTLEAIWMFSCVKSFRIARDKDLVAFDSERAEIDLNFFSEERDQRARLCFFKNEKRQIFLNDVKLPSPARLLGNVKSVIFSPEHLSLVKEGPDQRRRFIDMGLSQIKPSYFTAFSSFRRILDQRNALLKEAARNPVLADTFAVWNEKFAAVSSEVIYMRLKYVKVIAAIARDIYSDICKGKEELNVQYKSDLILPDVDVIEEKEAKLVIYESVINALYELRRKESVMLSTAAGPHRDDLDFTINAHSAKIFGSQGQQRSTVLALKLAEAKSITDLTGDRPAILLDDVLSELDHMRQEYILEQTKGQQTFITTCEKAKLNAGIAFLVENGSIRSI